MGLKLNMIMNEKNEEKTENLWQCSDIMVIYFIKESSFYGVP